jgi:hypothetical protein
MAATQFAMLANQALVVIVRKTVGRLPGKGRVAEIDGRRRALALLDISPSVRLDLRKTSSVD